MDPESLNSMTNPAVLNLADIPPPMALLGGRQERKHTEKLPKSRDLILEFVKQYLSLPRVKEIHITPKEIVVSRLVAENEPVVPPKTQESDVDLDFLIDRLDLFSVETTAKDDAYKTLLGICQHLASLQLFPTHLISLPGSSIQRWLKLPFPPQNVFGLQVLYTNTKHLTSAKTLVLGAPNKTEFLADCTHGVVVDIWEVESHE